MHVSFPLHTASREYREAAPLLTLRVEDVLRIEPCRPVPNSSTLTTVLQRKHWLACTATEATDILAGRETACRQSQS